jgi:hypothetical protein
MLALPVLHPSPDQIDIRYDGVDDIRGQADILEDIEQLKVPRLWLIGICFLHVLLFINYFESF